MRNRLGVYVLSCCMLVTLTEALESAINGPDKQQQQVKPVTASRNLLEYVPQEDSDHQQQPQQQRVHEHQHEKRDIASHATNAALALEALEQLANADLQQQYLLRGRRLPLYVDEPRYIVLRPSRTTPTGSQLRSEPSVGGFSFIPQRGRKSDPHSQEKRELSIKQMLEGGDYFVPNRGKKGASGVIKKVKFDDILGPEELFIPNRGKKELLELFGGTGGARRTTFNDLQPYYYYNAKKNVLNAIQNVGGKNGGADGGEEGELFYPTRGKKNVLDNLAQSQDTFFSSRGKRIPGLPDQLIPWEYLAADDSSSSSFDADFALDRYQTNKIIA